MLSRYIILTVLCVHNIEARCTGSRPRERATCELTPPLSYNECMSVLWGGSTPYGCTWIGPGHRLRAGAELRSGPVRSRGQGVHEITPEIERIIDSYFHRYWDFITQWDRTCYIKKIMPKLIKMQHARNVVGGLVSASGDILIETDVLNLIKDITQEIDDAVGSKKLNAPKCEDNALRDLSALMKSGVKKKYENAMRALIKKYGVAKKTQILDVFQKLWKEQWAHLPESEESEEPSSAHAYIGYFNNYDVSDWRFIYEQAVENFKIAKKQLLLAKELIPRRKKHIKL